MIPAYDGHGVVPPIRPGEHGASSERSPYPVDILELCQRFGGTTSRDAILVGLLDLRAALKAAGFPSGHQWLNGSFVEDVETTQGRPPNDVDVVSFLPFGNAANQTRLLQAHPQLFDSGQCKGMYKVDHYALAADRRLDEAYARRVGYWYSMWSHQRSSHRWKGFLSVPLHSNDAEARAWLASGSSSSGGTP